jgi:hypothetical protein
MRVSGFIKRAAAVCTVSAMLALGGFAMAANADSVTPTPVPTPVVTVDPSTPVQDSAPVTPAPADSPAPAASAPATPAAADSTTPASSNDATNTPAPPVAAPAFSAKATSNGDGGNGGYNNPPKDKVCSDSGSLTWTKNADLSTATVTLKDGFSSCDVSLNSYDTQGAIWETSGVQAFVDHATAHLTKANPTATLTVKVQGCFQQQDLYIGTTRYDGKDGALPLYPSSSTPAGLIDHWNGAGNCTPPPPVDVCANIAGNQSTVPAGFVQDGVNCNPVAATCTASTVDASVWTSEDGTVTTGPDGADFSTPGVNDKVNYFGRTLNVPFSGVTGGSYTVKNTGGPIVAYDFEVYQTGTSGFATIVFEPYVNGLTGTGTSGDGSFHTYVITGSSLVWNSKITSGEGSQAQPVTLTRMQELIPAATLIRAGLGQGKNNAGSLSTVSSFTDPACGTTTFPKKPVVVAPSATINFVCSAQGGTDGTVHLEAGTNDTTFDIVINGVVVDTEHVKAGGSFDYNTTLAEDSSGGTAIVQVKSGETAVTDEVTVSTDCLPPVTIIVTPPAPKVVAPTCNADGSLPTLVDGDGYTAKYDRLFDGPGVYTATYTVTGDNTAFETGTSVSYDLTVLGKTGNCPVVPSGNGGADTGLNGNQPGIDTSFWTAGNTALFGGGAFLVVVALFGVLAMARRRNRNNGEAGVEAQ